MTNQDLSLEDFSLIYEEEIFCAFMESGAYYDTDSEVFLELEYEDYLAQTGQWACIEKPKQLDEPMQV